MAKKDQIVCGFCHRCVARAKSVKCEECEVVGCSRCVRTHEHLAGLIACRKCIEDAEKEETLYNG